MAYDDLGYAAITDQRVRYALARDRISVELSFYLRWIPASMADTPLLFFAVPSDLTPGGEVVWEFVIRSVGEDDGVWSIGYWVDAPLT